MVTQFSYDWRVRKWGDIKTFEDAKSRCDKWQAQGRDFNSEYGRYILERYSALVPAPIRVPLQLSVLDQY